MHFILTNKNEELFFLTIVISIKFNKNQHNTGTAACKLRFNVSETCFWSSTLKTETNRFSGALPHGLPSWFFNLAMALIQEKHDFLL